MAFRWVKITLDMLDLATSPTKIKNGDQEKIKLRVMVGAEDEDIGWIVFAMVVAAQRAKMVSLAVESVAFELNGMPTDLTAIVI